MHASLERLTRWLGLDPALGFVLVGRAWSFLAGPVTLLLIGTYFTRAEQGFFYVFNNVLGLQVFLEFGLSQCLIQFASHEFVRLRFAADGRVTGDPAARDRLLALGKLALKWYAGMAVILLLLIAPGGQAFMALKPAAGVHWTAGWWLLCLVTAANLLTQPLWFILEGCNQIAFVAAYRAVALVGSGLTMWVAIWRGADLLAAGFAAIASALVSVAFLAWRWRGFVRDVLGHGAASRTLLREIWPFQSRMAVSAMSGYLIFSLFTPAVYYFRGAAEAGQMGMSWQLVNAVSALALAWISTRAPRFGMLIGQRRFEELDQLARRVTTQATVICALAAVAVLVLLAWVQAHYAFGTRLLGVGAVGLLFLAAVINQIVFGQAYFLRAHKREPFMQLSLLNAGLTATGVVFATWQWGAFGACVAYAVAQGLILPLATWVFLVKRREWRAELAEP